MPNIGIPKPQKIIPGRATNIDHIMWEPELQTISRSLFSLSSPSISMQSKTLNRYWMIFGWMKNRSITKDDIALLLNTLIFL